MTLLLALADLAEAACGRSRPVRWLVLLILGAAEAIARDHVAGRTGVPEFASPARMAVDADAVDDSISKAMRLAFVFRVLAAALESVLAANLATLPDEAAAPARYEAGALAALRDLIAAPPVERRDSS